MGWNKLFLFGLTGIALISITNCAPDRDLEDYRREQRIKEQNKYREVEGNYSGYIQWSEGPIAPLQMNFTLGSKTQSPPGTQTQEEIGILNLTLTAEAEKLLQADLFELAFDETTQEVTGTRDFGITGASEKSFVFKAKRNGSKIEGRIFEKGAESRSSLFWVSKEGLPLPETETMDSLKIQNSEKSPFKETFFEGVAEIPGLGAHQISASFQGEQVSGPEEFFQKIGNEVDLRTTLNLTPFVQITFENGKWDRLRKVYKAETQFTVSDGLVMKLWLQCSDFDLVFGENIPCFYGTDQKADRVPLILKKSPQLRTADSLPSYFEQLTIKDSTSPFVGTRLDLKTIGPSRTRDLREIFLYQKTLRAFLVFSKDIQFTLDPVFIEKTKGQLTTASQVNSYGKTFFVYLDCTPGNSSQIGNAWNPGQWNCDYRTSVTGGEIQLVFERLAL